MSDGTPTYDHDLARLLQEADGVIFDFDGPICALFPDGTALHAEKIKQAVQDGLGRLPLSITDLRDSHAILQDLRQDTSAAGGIVAQLVTDAEYEAVRTVHPTEHVQELVSQLVALGKALAVSSNNAPGPIREFLDREGMGAPFSDRIYGRDSEALQRMKPHPDSVLRAVDGLGLAPDRCLMIGDKVSDLEAALAAGTLFIGCTDDESEREQMLKLGADATVACLAQLLGSLPCAAE
ncbi:HAD family hydrolase [Streptomyces sp. NPDC050145]|uniref:HAD family hydrolase n=1 Tax=Streptomyces sp. NPDC050145 TaxID=3365602 RepID=UPI0037AEA8DF